MFAASGAVLAAARERAVRRRLEPAVHTADMFGAGHDAANRAVEERVGTARPSAVGSDLGSEA